MRVKIFRDHPDRVDTYINNWMATNLREIVRTDCTYAEGQDCVVVLVWYRE